MKKYCKQIAVILVLLVFWIVFLAALNRAESSPDNARPPINGTYLYIDPSRGLILDQEDSIAKNYNPNSLELCKKEEGWMFNPQCCCTHNWCHQVSCSTIKFTPDQTITVELKPGEHPRVLSHVIWRDVPKSRLNPSPDADKNICYVCASGHSLSCVFYLPGGIM